MAADIDFHLYDGFASSRRAFNALVPSGVPLSARVCPDGPDRSDYDLPDHKSAGMLACYVDETTQAPHIVWTRDDPGILAMAVAPQDATLAQLWEVWLTLPINPPSTSPSGTTPR